MNATQVLSFVLALCLAAITGQAFARGASDQGAPRAAAAKTDHRGGATDQPQRSAAGVSYVVGGVGDRSQDSMDRHYGDYALHLTTAQGRAYVTGAKLTVQDSQGRTMLETRMDGPLLYADLAPGQYTVTAEIDSARKTQKASISQGQTRKMTFSFAGADPGTR